MSQEMQNDDDMDTQNSLLQGPHTIHQQSQIYPSIKKKAQGLCVTPSLMAKNLGPGHQRDKLFSSCSPDPGEATGTTSLA